MEQSPKPYEKSLIEQEIEACALQLMTRGELLTWRYESNDNLVTLIIPNDKDEADYPESIFGVPTDIISLPRPVSFKEQTTLNESVINLVELLATAKRIDIGRTAFTALLTQSIEVLDLDTLTLAGNLRASPPTMKRWVSGESAPRRTNRIFVIRELYKLAIGRLQQELN